MSKKYSFIINALIIVLIVILVCVMMNYYASGSSVIPTNYEFENAKSGDLNNEPIPQITNTELIPKEKKADSFIEENENKKEPEQNMENNASGELIESTETNLRVEESGDIVNITTQPSPTSKPEQSAETSGKDSMQVITSPVIITSENEISSKEKREILSELDKTLMELLEVVDKVQTVDESRLPTDSEVQNP